MADIKISALTAATVVNATDVLPATQGAATAKVTAQQVADFARLVAVNSQTGTTYTLVLTDQGKVVRGNNAAAQTHTVPLNATVAFPVGASVAFRQVGAGQITIAPTGGVTLNIPTGYLAKTGRQGATIMIHKVAADEWDVTGDLST